jgi:hypothetical protein
MRKGAIAPWPPFHLDADGHAAICQIAKKHPRPPPGELTEAAFYIASRLGSQCDVGALEKN